MTCLAAVVLGAHLVSFHPNPAFHTVTPGAYAKACGYEAGVLRNSEGGTSVHVGKVISVGPLDVAFGAISGYHAQAIRPMVIPSYRSGHFRIAFAPAPRGNWAVHFSAETSL